MDYLSNYGLTKDDLEDLENNLDVSDYQEFLFKEEKIIPILDYLRDIGLTNIKEIILYKPNLFYDSLETIKKAISEANLPNLIELINEDACNFDLIGY